MADRANAPRPWLPAALVTSAVALLICGPVLGAPWVEVVGHPMSPGLDHLWGLWVTAEGLWTHGPYLRDTAGVNYPMGFRALQYEAPNLLLFLPGYWLGGGGVAGAALGWNLLQAGAPVVGAVGCWLLGRDLFGRTPALAVLVAVFAGSPFLLAHPYMGHSEYLVSVLWPWHLWALRRWLEGARWTWGVAAGLGLGAMAATASYLPVFLAILEPPLGLALAARRRAWLRLLSVGAIALPLGVAFGWELAQPWPHGHGAFAGQSGDGLRPATSWEHLLPGMLRLWPGEPTTDLNEQAAYPGLVAVGLALGGAVFERRARWWGLLALLAFALGAGSMVEVAGRRWLLLAGMLEQVVPPLDMVHFWQRIAPLAALPLGVAATAGAARIAARTTRPALVSLLLAVLVLADQATWPRGLVLPAPSTRIDPPPALAGLLSDLPEGALLQYPLPVVNMPGPPVSTGPYLVWQRSVGRPIPTTQNLLGDGTIASSYLSRVVANRQAQRVRSGSTGATAAGGRRVVGAGELTETERTCARSDAVALRAQGYVAAVLYLRIGKGEALEPLLTEVLGEPRTATDLRLYPLPEAGPGGLPCPLPDPARVVASVLRLR